MKFRFTGYHKFLDPGGYPAVAPPWGTLNAINLKQRRICLKIPLGEYPELAAKDKRTPAQKLRGADRHRRRAAVHRCNRLRKKFRASINPRVNCSGRPPLPFSVQPHSRHLRSERPPIRRHRRGRWERSQVTIGRRVRRLRAASRFTDIEGQFRSDALVEKIESRWTATLSGLSPIFLHWHRWFAFLRLASAR